MARLLLFMAAAMAAFSADIAGNWKATAEGPNGTMERSFVFKVDGSNLTGETTSSFAGKSVINDGKVDGDSFAFTIVANIQGNEVKLSYKGKVTGDDIRLTSSFGNSGQTIEWSGKRTK
ncbi:MAG: hypothetical protein ACT4P8_13795 [Betaproteobacteria bacterium]